MLELAGTVEDELGAGEEELCGDGVEKLGSGGDGGKIELDGLGEELEGSEDEELGSGGDGGKPELDGLGDELEGLEDELGIVEDELDGSEEVVLEAEGENEL